MTSISATQALALCQDGALYQPVYQLIDAHGTPYTCDDITLTLDETGTDYINVDAQLSTPTSIDVLTAPRFTLTLGLDFLDLGQQCPSMASYELVARTLTVTGRESARLTLQSLESLIRDAGASHTRAYTASSTLNAAVTEIIHDTLPTARIISDLPGTATFLTGTDTLTWETFSNNWGIIQEMCDGADATCYHDGHIFHITYADYSRPTITYSSALQHLIEYELTISRDTFANSVTTTFKNGVTARADNPTGRYSVSMIGRKTLLDDIPHDGSATQATKRATARLARALTSGHELHYTLARLPFGLQPGDTTSVQTLEDAWNGTLTAITYNFKKATSEITLRQIRKD